MTDGTSQGLFIVVAIVIFGIFTLMAYILFEDTLSPALASMFTDVTEKSSYSLKGYKSKKLIDFNTILLGNPAGDFTLHKDFNKHELTLTSIGKQSGIQIPMKGLITENNDYYLEFDMVVLEGKVTSYGGHLDISNTITLRIDDVLQHPETTVVNILNDGLAFDEPLVPGDSVNVKIMFTYDRPGGYVYENIPLSIQPNRLWDTPGKGYGEPYKVMFKNLSMVDMGVGGND